jgi:hypothetical protein
MLELLSYANEKFHCFGTCLAGGLLISIYLRYQEKNYETSLEIKQILCLYFTQSPCTTDSSKNKPHRHEITEILLKNTNGENCITSHTISSLSCQGSQLNFGCGIIPLVF